MSDERRQRDELELLQAEVRALRFAADERRRLAAEREATRRRLAEEHDQLRMRLEDTEAAIVAAEHELTVLLETTSRLWGRT